jgi:hypothetical protein
MCVFVAEKDLPKLTSKELLEHFEYELENLATLLQGVMDASNENELEPALSNLMLDAAPPGAPRKSHKEMEGEWSSLI